MIIHWILLLVAIVALVYFIPKKNKDKIVKLAIFFWLVMLVQDDLALFSHGSFSEVVQWILLLIAIGTLVVEFVHAFKNRK